MKPFKTLAKLVADDPMAKYDVCRICGTYLNKQTRTYARESFEQKVCSPACMEKDVIDRFGCCKLAVPTACVCAYSFKCHIHGTTHIGSHD